MATVNGQEITLQDVAAEARSRAGGAATPEPILLQNVVGRVLLAQAAHRSKLDSSPDYPSDFARLKQDYLARKMLQMIVKPAGAPTAAQVSQTIVAHPFQFDRRQRLEISQLRFSGEDALRAVQGLDNLNAMVERLKSLSVSFTKSDPTLDTAQLPDALAGRLVAEPVGTLFTLRQGETINEIVVKSRESVDLGQAQEQALATELTRKEVEARQVQAEVNRLERQGHIAYQSGYAPSQHSAKTGG